ncbi:LytR/AlgR family response regulator transcription factor [Pedobacter sp. GR22-6]|uniref:LytR/AlgR family response regulator transcription factor n=1 Tax=Pedobacter sp. GR22-6 TaxID=3127957 RepID=UPI00307E6722
MSPLKCIAIDDEPLALELIKTYASKFPALQLLHTFEDAIYGAEYLKKHVVDLLFIDINMPDITGIDLVRSLDVRPMVIFTTAYKNFAYEGFELDALDFLLKPIDFERFSRTINKAIDYHQYKQNPKSASSDSIYVHSEYRLVRIVLEEISYIESFGDYVTIHQLNEKPVATLMSLKKILEKLPEKQFRRIHRSFIVSIDQIKSLHNRKVQLRAGNELPIGDSYMQLMQEWLKP